jgi:hypothetical protein
MYTIIKACGKDNSDKLKTIAEKHSLDGDFYFIPTVGSVFLFEYNDDSGKIMRSSTIESIVTVNNQIRIITRNSEYWFEKVEE